MEPESGEEEALPVRREVDLGTAVLMPDIDIAGGWSLALDGVIQSYVDLADPTHLEFEYFQQIGHVVDVFADPGEPISALHLGGGALTLPRYVAATRPGSPQRVVEIDAGLVDLVREHLPWDESTIEVVVGDARTLLEQSPDASASLVVADVFRGALTPARAASLEFISAAARVLRDDGVYAANLADESPFVFLRSQIAAALAAFPHVFLIAEPATMRGRRYGNVILVGAHRPPPLDELVRRLAADPFPARVTAGPALIDFAGDARPATDDRPVASLPPPDTFRP